MTAETGYIDPDSQGRGLTREAVIDPSARVKTTSFGIFNEIGPRCRISETSFGDYSYIGEDCEVMHTSIGKFSSIAANVRINPGNHPLERAALHHFTYRASKYGFGDDEPEFFAWRKSFHVSIGHDVWIGHGAILLPGVSIGNGAVVGAGSVVTRDVEDFAIVIGTPAKLHRHRFAQKIRAALNRIAWWDWPADRLSAALLDFRKLPIEAFCAKYDIDDSAPHSVDV